MNSGYRVQRRIGMEWVTVSRRVTRAAAEIRLVELRKLANSKDRPGARFSKWRVVDGHGKRTDGGVASPLGTPWLAD